jgi:hypothetical protein
MKRLIGGFAVCAVLAFGAMDAGATPTLRLTDLVTHAVVTIEDGGAFDSNPLAGAVTFNGAVGAWDLNVATGTTKPRLGSAISPMLDLNSVDMLSTGAGQLRIEFSEIGYGPMSGISSTFMIGGTTTGFVSGAAYLDSGNILFGEGTNIGSYGPLGTGSAPDVSFSAVAHGNAAGANIFSMTEVLTIVHGEHSDITSFNTKLNAPEPGTLLLLGSGLAMVGLLRMKRK